MLMWQQKANQKCEFALLQLVPYIRRNAMFVLPSNGMDSCDDHKATRIQTNPIPQKPVIRDQTGCNPQTMATTST